MPNELIGAIDIQTAVEIIVYYIKDTGDDQPKAIYFDGWGGLGASAVIRAIGAHPPPSLLEEFDKIIHIDYSRWESQRALQRAIADELKLTGQVAADFDAQDEEDDFSGIDQASRAEIGHIARVIARTVSQYRCLFVLHNGSNGMVDLLSCGIPQFELFGTRVLWTFRGRLRCRSGIKEKVPSSHLYFVTPRGLIDSQALLAEEAGEMALYANQLGLSITPEIAKECCLYLVALHKKGAKDIDYNWTAHASNYWVCDGILGGGQDNQAWELARALQQQIRLDDYPCNTDPEIDFKLPTTSREPWISVVSSNFQEIPPGKTSLFFTPPKLESIVVSLPSCCFRKASQLRVLKLCSCTFSFSSPPFHCCHNLRFLGLDRCIDKQQPAGEEETRARAVETFQRLWVLDVCHTDWELDFPRETEEAVVAADIREVHINRGRIWRTNFAWRRLPNLRKLRVDEPTSSWETGREDGEFMDMVKLELLDLSRNSTIQVLPSLSGAANLRTLVLDGCVGLEHVGPQGLPPLLESFSLDAGADKDEPDKIAKISCVSLAGCARLVDFRLRGPLPNLEELDLSHTALIMLALEEVGQAGNLKRVFLVGCKQLRSISWPKYWERMRHRMRLLCISTLAAAGEVVRKQLSCDSLKASQGGAEKDEYGRAFVAVADMRFLQSLVTLWRGPTKFQWNLCFSSSTPKEDVQSTGQLAAGSPLPRWLAYNDVNTKLQQTTSTVDGTSVTAQLQPLDVHMELGEGISHVTNAVSARGREAIRFVMENINSLHVHDSSSITTVIPEHIISSSPFHVTMDRLKWCHVERCLKLDTVFAIVYEGSIFSNLETFSAAHLLMAGCIWRRPSSRRHHYGSFAALRAIHLHSCPRLRYVYVLGMAECLTKLETLHILCCGDLRHVFPVHQDYQELIAAANETKGMLEFPMLKDMYLYELPSLQLICEAKMYAPKLETIYIRGCWGLRRLPATDGHRPVAVDCEKDWWDKLKWDGMKFGHHRSLYQPRHSKYYKKERLLRGTVLR